MPERVKIAVLGAPAVGKTSIIHQFVFCYFSSLYKPTWRRNLFRPNVVVGSHVYELNIVDPPQIPNAHSFNLHEWAELQYCSAGVPHAGGYLLVYDVSVPISFQYVQVLRDQCIEQRKEDSPGDVPIVVLGNKRDLESSRRPLGAKRSLAAMIRKSWKCEYLECSAKYNWNVCQAFKELIQRIDALRSSAAADTSSPTSRNNNHLTNDSYHMTNHHDDDSHSACHFCCASSGLSCVIL